MWVAPPTPPTPAATQEAKPPKPKREKQKNDPKYVAMARELRDRYLEEMNAGLILPEAWGGGKYDVSRQLEAAPIPVAELRPTPAPEIKLLKAA